MSWVVRRNSRHSRREAVSLISAALSVDLAFPPKGMWVVSPWVSDIQVLDNSLGGFGRFFPTSKPRLSDLLHNLASRGTTIVLVTKDVETNRPFLQSLESGRSRLPIPDRLIVRLEESSRLHTKAIVSEGYVVSGSMNFTYAGTMLNDEVLELRTESGYVAESRIAAHALYGGAS